jgi:hypothetical protein
MIWSLLWILVDTSGMDHEQAVLSPWFLLCFPVFSLCKCNYFLLKVSIWALSKVEITRLDMNKAKCSYLVNTLSYLVLSH